MRERERASERARESARAREREIERALLGIFHNGDMHVHIVCVCVRARGSGRGRGKWRRRETGILIGNDVETCQHGPLKNKNENFDKLGPPRLRLGRKY